MKNQLQTFNNEEFGTIRTILIDGEVYFVGKDVATALAYIDPFAALKQHVDEEDKIVITRKEFEKMASNQETGKTILSYSDNNLFDSNPMGGTQRITFINESGLYSLIFNSTLPKAKEFRRWVTSKVLPSIRKYGYYVAPTLENYLIAC